METEVKKSIYPVSEASYRKATFIIGSVPLLAAALAPSATYPFLMLVLPSLALLSYLPVRSWEKMAILPLMMCILINAFVYAGALYSAYSPKMGWITVTVLNLLALIVLKRKIAAKEIDNEVITRYSFSYFIPVIVLALVLVVIFFYGMVFDTPSFNNGPYPAFVQMGLNIMRSGSFYLLPHNQSAYDTTGFFYTPAYPGIVAWLSSGIPFSLLGRGLGFLAPLMVTSFCLIMMAIGYRMKCSVRSMATALLLFFPSYALFKISFEIESDNLALSCTAFFLYLLIRLAETSTVQKRRILTIFLLATWAFSWLIRMHLAFLFAAVLMGLLVLSPPFRRITADYFSNGPYVWSRPVRIGFLLLMLMTGPFWQGLLWMHTGSPIAPRSLTPFGLEIMRLKPEFGPYTPESEGTATVKPDADSTLGKQILYDFFPVVTDQGTAKNVFKSVRAFLHGNTFSGLLTMVVMVGLFNASRRVRQTGWLSMQGVALIFLSSLIVVFGATSYYYKLFFIAVPIFAALAGVEIDTFAQKFSNGIHIVNSTAVFFGALFLVSFLWSGVGTWSADRRWAIFKTSWIPGNRQWIKNGDDVTPVVSFLKNAPANQKMMFFHPEPGHAVSYLVDRQPFWEDFHYDSQQLTGLHRLSSPEKVLHALHALKIKYLVNSFSLDRYGQGTDLDWLPRMMKNGDPRVKKVATSSSRVYEVFLVEDLLL